MAKHTLKERLEAGLKALGFTYHAPSGARTGYWHKQGESEDRKYYIGNNGGLRRGRNKVSSISIGWYNESAYNAFLSAGDKALDPLSQLVD